MAKSPLRKYLKHGLLPQLAVFEAAARLGGITRAADELGLAQPTASLQLRKLAATIGLPLFEYSAGHARPTAAGKCVQAACIDVFARLRTLQADVEALRGDNGVALRVAATTAADRFAPRLLNAFAQRHPGLGASLEIRNRGQLLERLERGEDHVYILANPPENGDVVRQAILKCPLVAIAARGHALAGHPALALADLAGEPFLMREPGSGTRMVVEALCAAQGFAPAVRMVLNTNAALREAVAAGLGIAIVPRPALDPPPDIAGDVVMLDVPELPDQGYWYLVYRAGHALSPAAEAFVTFARDAARALAVEPVTPPVPQSTAPRSRKAMPIGSATTGVARA